MRALGLMSGTSLDGIDAALVDLIPRGDGYAVTVVRFDSQPFESRLRERLEAALPPERGSTAAVAQLHADLAAAFTATAIATVEDEHVDFVATHGLTIYHDGPRSTTLQIGRPYELRDALRASVIWDFRSADCALGGSGAPLVPFVDAIVFGSGEEDRIAVNIGGICNLTVLRRSQKPSDVVAFDVGAGTMLLDAFVHERTGETMDFDGKLSAKGTVDEKLLEGLLADPYFALEPPKSTGREQFGRQMLDAHRHELSRLGAEDGCATLVAFTVRPLADAIRRYGAPGSRVILGGGGSRNPALVQMLGEALGAGVPIETSDDFGINADAKEAVAFAILGYETLRGRPANVPRVTGAHAPAILGSIVPYELPVLLARVALETVDANR
ncbi:MAG: anhydro-N-acetylmuramic acid kinase [Vulcanimicrobiaceae bacterium]|jgi:anhydro-N-acetylmuramic acid kinase